MATDNELPLQNGENFNCLGEFSHHNSEISHHGSESLQHNGGLSHNYRRSSDESDDYNEFSQFSLERRSNIGNKEVDENFQFSSSCNFSDMNDPERLQELELEQEQLNQSLLALTTHFAQVQFRLKQIVDASAEEKELLLKELEEFAFRGIPDIQEIRCNSDEIEESVGNLVSVEQSHEQKMNLQRQKQQELITKLKDQLEDLEQYAYETGDAGLPQNVVLEKQKIIIDQLKGKLPLDLGGFDKLTSDELRLQVDHAISQLINPAKMKEQLVSQLKTQIIDLERFIIFLQGEVVKTPQEDPKCTCNCPLHGKDVHTSKCGDTSDGDGDCCSPTRNYRYKRLKQHQKHVHDQKIRETTIGIIRKALAVLQMFSISHFGCGTAPFHRNLLKKTSKGNHWGDLRANLEIAVQHVIELASQEQPVDSDYTSDSEDSPIVMCNEKLTTAVRKELAIAIRDLMQHGLMPMGHSRSLVPLSGCFPTRSSSAKPMMHPWDLLLKYYQQKQGDQYNSTPARKLSQSFNLDIIGGSAITPKQTLLGTVHAVISSHTPLKRSEDSHFKAFICTAVNEKKLVTWLKLLFRNRKIVEDYYQPWSYVAKTGFEDSIKTLERLNKFHFDLPVDLAVRQFQNIRDAF
ncbi:RUN domain-containing protein 1 [Nymphon striatum]|nr:RUN domain-containing protein 1 [Nymphon striatum]